MRFNHENLERIKAAMRAAGWTVHSSSDAPPLLHEDNHNTRTEPMTTTTTYSAETVAELALELRTVSRLSWALHEQNAQFKRQLESQDTEISLLKLQRDVLQSSVRVQDRQLEAKTLKIQRLLTMETTPISVLKLSLGLMRALQRLRCKTIADVTRLNKANMKNNKGYRLIFEAMAEYLEGRS